jgi:hypothetical protein
MQMNKGYKHLTYEQKCQIYTLKQQNFTQQAIANTIIAFPSRPRSIIALQRFHL